MARFDKVDPISGGFRAKLGFAPVASDVGKVIGVTINGSGQAVKSSASNCDGVICLSSLLAQADPVDVMTDGEIVDVGATDGITSPAAGAEVFAGATGGFGAGPAAGANGVRIGRFVEAWRLVVRVGRVQG